VTVGGTQTGHASCEYDKPADLEQNTVVRPTDGSENQNGEIIEAQRLEHNDFYKEMPSF